MSRLIDADKLLLSLNDNYLANCPTGNETLAIQDYRESLCEGLEIAMATVEGAPTVNGWISAKDRLPEKYLDVLVLVQYPKVNGYTGHYVVIAWKSTDDDSWDSDNDNFNNDPEGVVTHWMPLPEPPKENEDD